MKNLSIRPQLSPALTALGLALGLALAGCASSPSNATRQDAMAIPGGSGGPAWDYPEIASASTTNTWVSSYSGCGPTVARQQSPIMIVPSIAQAGAQKLAIAALGSKVALKMSPTPNSFEFPVTSSPPKLTLTFPGFTFDLVVQAFHLHAPAEHIIYGSAPSALELHIVTKGTNRNKTTDVYTMVLAVRADLEPSLTTSKLAPVAEAVDGTSSDFDLVGVLNLFTDLSPGVVFTYVGGLTTPPCSDPTLPRVTWFVLSNPIAVDPQSFKTINNALVKAAGGRPNVRLPQPYVTSGSGALQVHVFGQ